MLGTLFFCLIRGFRQQLLIEKYYGFDDVNCLTFWLDFRPFLGPFFWLFECMRSCELDWARFHRIIALKTERCRADWTV